MGTPEVVTVVVLVLAIVAFASDRIAVDVVAVAVALALFLTGVLDLGQALAGFADPAVVFVAALFVVAEALESTGVTAWIGERVIERVGTARFVVLLVLTLLTALLSALISVTAAVAAMLPVAVIVAARAGLPTSQILLPLAFAAHAGSLLLLTGTPVNILVSEAARDAGAGAFGYAEFAWVGVPLVVGTIVLVMWLGPHTVPLRSGAGAGLDPASHARLLRTEYDVTMASADLVDREVGVAEVVVAPRSPLVGSRTGIGKALPHTALTVISARRTGRPVEPGPFTLRPGDVLLLRGPWEALRRMVSSGRVLPVDSPDALRRTVPLTDGSWWVAALILLGMVVTLASGAAPAAIVALAAAALLVVTRTVSTDQAYGAISWSTVVLIAGMIPLSTAVDVTGLADRLADLIVRTTGGGSPRLALLVIVVVTVALGQVISNTATVLILSPVTVATAQGLDVSVVPFLMALTVAGAASFLTPIATPANMMVMQSGGYRFGDYWRIGLPLAALFTLVAVLYVPWVWRF